MPVLYLENVPREVFDRIHQLAEAHGRTVEAEAVRLLRQGLLSRPGEPSQAELLADLRRHSFTPPPGTPDSVELLREDRAR
jgi:plasmid stability protein